MIRDRHDVALISFILQLNSRPPNQIKMKISNT